MDDEELVLKGSELEKLLVSVRPDVGTFSRCSGSEASSVNINETSGSHQVKTSLLGKFSFPIAVFVDKLLGSGLMMEEDIYCFLDEPAQDLQIPGRLNHFILPGCSLVMMFFSCRFRKNFKLAIPLFLSSAAVSLFVAYKSYQVVRLKNGLDELIEEMKSLTRFVKKTTNYIKEVMTVVKTRLVIANLRKMSPELKERYYQQVESDISSNCLEFIKFLREVIDVTKEATFRIISTPSFTNDSKSFFLASCSNCESNFSSLGNPSVLKLQELCVAHLVMQSEYLRALGMWMCSPVHSTPDNVFINVEFYKDSISKKHKEAQHVFGGPLFGKYVERKGTSVNVNSGVLAKLNSAIATLIIEATSLQNYANSNVEESIEDRQDVISHLENCIVECAEILKEYRSYKSAQKTGENDKIPINSSLNPDEGLFVQKTGVEVGYSDFSVSGEDKVYLCITDTDDASANDNEDSMVSDELPKYPNTLLKELKCVLEEKRLEFKQRESNAIKNCDLEDVENQFDLVGLHRPVETAVEPHAAKPPQVISDSQVLSRKPSASPSHPNNSVCMSNLSDYSLSRSIAHTAAKTSTSWNCHAEEFFGDEDDEDCGSSSSD